MLNPYFRNFTGFLIGFFSVVLDLQAYPIHFNNYYSSDETEMLSISTSCNESASLLLFTRVNGAYVKNKVQIREKLPCKTGDLLKPIPLGEVDAEYKALFSPNNRYLILVQLGLKPMDDEILYIDPAVVVWIFDLYTGRKLGKVRCQADLSTFDAHHPGYSTFGRYEEGLFPISIFDVSDDDEEIKILVGVYDSNEQCTSINVLQGKNGSITTRAVEFPKDDFAIVQKAHFTPFSDEIVLVCDQQNRCYPFDLSH